MLHGTVNNPNSKTAQELHCVPSHRPREPVVTIVKGVLHRDAIVCPKSSSVGRHQHQNTVPKFG